MGIFDFLKRNKKQTEQTEEITIPETVEEGEAEVAEDPVEVQPEIDKPPIEVQSEEIEPPVEVQPEVVEPPVEVQPKAAEPSAPKNEEGKVVVKIKYNRSFTAKLIQSDDTTKKYYGEIKNELSRYKVKSRTSWRHETFKSGRKLIAKISFRGKALSLYLALDPKAYEGTKYKINDVSSVAKNAEVPTLYKIKNALRCKYAKDLIAAAMGANGLEAGVVLADDYVSKYPYEELEPLLERGLIKLLKLTAKGEGTEEGLIEISEERYEQLTAETDYTEVAVAVEEEPQQPEEEPQYPEVVESITVVEAEERIDDEEVEAFVQESERYSDKTKKDIVNIDALGKYFNAGEDVTIEEIKKRVPSVNKKATYIKVLARGALDKALNVEADDFSPAAVKMIVLTGGTVSRTKTRN